MLKKLYFHTREGRSYDFDIVATAKVDKPGFTEWIVQVDTNNELGVHEVQASTDDCTFDVVSDDSLIIWELPPSEEAKDPNLWTVNIETIDFKFYTIEGEIHWTKHGDLKVETGDCRLNYLSSRLREFDVNDMSRVITARYKQ
jgi:hypothetical protein|nr:MAG TPA: hypothetical protein [Caudoviricetes sp.]